MNTGLNYNMFYNVLLEEREMFHSYGRIDDSNAKLDEISKLIAISFYDAMNDKRFNIGEIREIAIKDFGDESLIASALRKKFQMVCQDKMFYNDDGTNIFGSEPTLNIQNTEDSFAEKIIMSISKIDFLNLINKNTNNDFDIINECFGHFVRENFRNNKEDAQYMTPAEITQPILDMIFSDIMREKYINQNNISDFRIMDPTCGVGTLLVESCRKTTECINEIIKSKSKNEDAILQFVKKNVIGQDKVDRMVRLSKINTMLMGGNISNIHSGNSIIGKSELDKYFGKIDLIFTNPPFGAEYNVTDLDDEMISFLNSCGIYNTNLPSEILLLIKCIMLLKDNGYLAIVLPDSVFSAKGIYANIRQMIIRNFDIRAIVELPTVTFAQAGTRTKTSILYLRKRKPESQSKITMCVCNNVGFNVKEKMGVPIKICIAENDMNIISSIYSNNANNYSEILCNTPSITKVSRDNLIGNILNPSFYSAERLSIANDTNEIEKDGFKLTPLSELVDFKSLGGKNLSVSDEIKHISVLHINPDSTINFDEVEQFIPVSKGRLCAEGDLIFSKINPRIPRMAVIPPYNKKLVCSNEFEIMRGKSNVNIYVLCLLLKSTFVKRQIENLTSGTSSSHNRIKREQLFEILIPYPSSNEKIEKMEKMDKVIKSAFEKKYESDVILRKQLEILEHIKT